MSTGKPKTPIRQNRIKAIRIYLSLCLVASFFTGCVVLPHPMKQMARGQVRAQMANDLTPVKATKDEVLTSFHSPTAIWEKENVFIYYWEESKSAITFATCGSSDTSRMWTKKMTLLQFNDQDVSMDMKIGHRPELENIGQYLTDWVYGEGSQESKSLKKMKKVVPVLMQIVTSSDGELQNEWANKISIELRGFRTGGLIKVKKQNRARKKLKKDGWVLYYVEPGNLYTSFVFKRHDKSLGPIFRAKVKNSDSLIYIGSFHFNRRSYKYSSGSHRFVDNLDESDLARQVAAEMFPENPDLMVSLAVEHDGPLILASPTDFKQPGVELE